MPQSWAGTKIAICGASRGMLGKFIENNECLSLFQAPVCAWRTHAFEWGHWSKRCDGSKINTCSTQLTWVVRESDVIVDCEWEWLLVYWSQEFLIFYTVIFEVIGINCPCYTGTDDHSYSIIHVLYDFLSGLNTSKWYTESQIIWSCSNVSVFLAILLPRQSN